MTLRSCVIRALIGAAACCGLLSAGTARAAVTCPNANPIVQENNCAGSGTTAWNLSNYSENIGGYAVKTSFAKGEDVPLKIARNAPTFPATKVDIAVYRTGYYNNTGARLIPAAGAIGVTVNNDFTCRAMDATTGKLDCGNWNVTYTIPGAALPATGVYLAKLTATDTGIQNWIVFVVRDDDRVPEAKILAVVPTATWQAYNTWGGKSLYFDKNGGANTVAGTQRAVKVSFNRPLDHATTYRDRYVGPDMEMVEWLEREGYDVAYTDDYQAHSNPAELRQHQVVTIIGHSEYWSLEEFNAVKAARDAGVNIASFSANTAYWKVRYEDSGRTLVCYKTVEGAGSGNSGAVSANDWGPDGIQGTADDALGADGRQGTADDRPDNATTTFRDNGAPPGDPTAPPSGRVGPDMPENQLFGVMYVGDNDSTTYPLVVPAANAAGEFAGDRIWRNAGLSTTSSTTIGSSIVGWEWDAVPTQAQYASREPSGVKRLSDSPTTASTPSWLQDEGRQRATTPPPGQPGTVNAVKYVAPSGALVFASGTMQWASALSSATDARIQQATYNVLSDMGVQPLTPVGVTLDPADRPPRAVIAATPTSGPTPLTVSFDGTGSSDPEGPIARYEWDLDNDGAFDDGTGSRASFTYTRLGMYTARLRVTDSAGQTDVTTVQITAGSPPTPSIDSPAASTNWAVGDNIAFSGSARDSDGNTIPPSGLSWQLTLGTCGASGGACTEQQLQTFNGVAQGTFTAPDAPAPAYLKLKLTATDANGLTASVERRLDPRTVTLTMDASTPGLQVTLGTQTAAAPFTRDVIVGSSNPIAAPSPQTLGTSVYRFGAWSDGGAQSHTITAPATATTYRARFDASAVGATLLGTESVQPSADSNDPGMAEAFKTTASLSGTVGYLFVYLDPAATASELVAGLYADNAGKPGRLLTSGRLTSPQAGAFSQIVVPDAQVTAGSSYWIAVLGPAGKPGSVRFRMTLGGGRAETSASSTLTDLPATWSTGSVYSDGPLAAYAAASGAPQPPVLSVTPSSLSFSAVSGGSSPAAKVVSVANTGGGSLSYAVSDDASWLSESPVSGSAPGSVSVSADVSGLAAGTYSATVTVDGGGVSGSPARIPVTFTVSASPPPTSGLVAAYGFEEASGTTVLDSSGNGNAGTITGATRITTGKSGRALSFNGSGNNVMVPDSPSLRLTNGMTLEAWVYPTTLGTIWRTVIFKEQPGELIYALYANTNGKRPDAVAYLTSEVESTGTASLAANTWTHLAATYDGATLRLFVNGTQVASKAAPGSMPAVAGGPLRLGGNSVWGEWFAGRLDDVRVYNRALTAAQIGADMAAGVS